MPRAPGKQMSVWAQVAFYSGLGFILPAAALAGFGLGWWLDQRLHTSPVLSLIFGVIGASAGVVEILAILSRSEKDDSANSSNDRSGGG